MFEAKLDEFAQEHDLAAGEFVERLKQVRALCSFLKLHGCRAGCGKWLND
jgi:hypothetical protein